MSSVKKRPDGKWRARYRDEAGKEHAKHFDRKTDAERWLARTVTAIHDGSYVDPRAGRVTLASYYADWSSRQLWESGTRRAVDFAVRSCPFAELELRAVKRSHVESWVKEMSTRGLAALTIHTRVQNVRSVFKAAVRDRVILADPADGVTLPRKRRQAQAMEIPSPDTVAAIYGAAAEWFRPFVALCAFAGLRLGEAAGVQLGDVDFLRRTLHVRRQVHRQSGMDVEIRAPKYGSERDVSLPDDLLQILSKHVETVGVYGDAEWLFPGREGGPAWPRRYTYEWERTLLRAGLEDVTIHTLRHFYASGLIASGCDVVTVQRALGHSSASVTLNTYSHLWPSAEDRTRGAAQALMGEVLGDSADYLRTAAAGPA